MDKSMVNNLTSGSLFRKIISFSLPYMLANLLQTLYNLVDLAVVGAFVGSTGVSAVSISGQIMHLLYATGIGLDSGGQILVSQQVGSGDLKRLNRTIGTAVTFNACVSLCVALAGFAASSWALGVLNTPPEALEEAYAYLTICCIGIPFTFGYGNLCGILRGMGDSKRPLLMIAVAASTNIVLDLILVICFDMGVVGTAIATIGSQILSFVFAFSYLYKNRVQFGFDFKLPSFRVDWKILRVILQLGLPLMFMNISVSISMLFVTSYINNYGVVASSVSGIGSKFYSIISIVTNAANASVASCVGQNIAARKIDRAKKSVYFGFALCLAAFAVMAVLCLTAPEWMFDLFSNDPEVIAMAPEYLNIAIWMYLSFALMAPTLGLVNGVGFTTFNLAVAFLDGVVARIGLSLLFGVTLGMGLHGFWWGSALAGYISVILPGIYFLSGKWKHRQLLTEKI